MSHILIGNRSRTIEKRNKDVRATSNEDNESEKRSGNEDESAVGSRELLGNNQNTIIPPRESLTLNKNKEISPLNTVRERIAELHSRRWRGSNESARKEGTGEDIQLLTDEEMNQIAEKYPSLNFEMDEEMLDDDDLLDEIPEEEEGVPETQEVEAQKKESSKVRVIGEGRNTADKGSRALTGLHQGTEKKAKLPNEKSQQAAQSRLWGTRSPDTKRIAASKKLVNRGRASPKGKLVKYGRLNRLRASHTTTIPRTEVNGGHFMHFDWLGGEGPYEF
ncbi:hypothetical protein Bca52824_027559 [Brassica carinata]|uniref:Uncharacterized protein n=1 Tax=Brassica carinata TaxID=52824 RepID=A0A8X7VAP2_BRACI|nr:hypothetical protein Bca52824_027559 [Brassica carinata]